MKHIISSLLLLSFSAYAVEVNLPVKLREGRGLKERHVIIKDLLTADSFNGKYFKIVKGESNTPILIDNSNDRELTIKAATVYHHLTIAKDHFNKLKLQEEISNDQIIVRLEIMSEFDGHKTSSTEKPTKYNYIEAHLPDSFQETGSREIWLHKGRNVKINPANGKVGKLFMNKNLQNDIDRDLEMKQLAVETRAYLQGFRDPIYYEFHIYQAMLSIGLTELVPLVYNMGRLASKTFRFDPAYIPEVIYHEYSHIALEQYFDDNRMTHLSEGYPNFFAYKISGVGKLYNFDRKALKGGKMKYSENSERYSIKQEYGKVSKYGGFVIGVLADIDTEFKIVGETLITKSLKYLNTESSLRQNFHNSFVFALEEVCRDKFVTECDAKMRKLKNILYKRGL